MLTSPKVVAGADAISPSGGPYLNVAHSLQVTPAGANADESADRRLDDDEIHQLSVHELLERQSPERLERLPVDPESKGCEEELHQVEQEPVADDGQGIREHDSVERVEVDQRRGHRQRDLEEDHVRDRKSTRLNSSHS